MLRLALIVQAFDHLTSPVRLMERAVTRLDQVSKKAKGMEQWASRMQAAGEKVRNVGIKATAIGVGAAAATGMSTVPGAAADAEEALNQIANAADLSASQIARAHSSLLALTGPTNQYLNDLIRGLGIYTAAGMEFNAAMGALPQAARVATAEGAELDDLAKATFASVDNLKVSVQDIGKSLEVMTVAGQAGRFEIRDMARYFPLLTAGAAQLHMKGVPAVASLGAALQVAMKAAGDPSEAATNVANFLQKITAPETVRNFAKFGVNLEAEMKKSAKKGTDPIRDMVMLVKRLTGGDEFKLGQLFGDLQVQNFMKPMLANMGEFDRIRAESLNSHGKVDQDFARVMAGTNQQAKEFRVNMARVSTPPIAGLMAYVNQVLRFINARPAFQATTAAAIAGITGAGGLVTGLGQLSLGFKPSLVILSKLTWWAQAGYLRLLYLKDGLTGAALASKLQGVASFFSVAGLRAAAAATWSWTAALLANPVTWVVVGVVALAGAAYLIYRNWGPISRWFGMLWFSIRASTGNFLAWIREVPARIGAWFSGMNLRESGAKLLRTFAQGIIDMEMLPFRAMMRVVQRVRRLLPFSPAKEGPLRDLHRVRLVETVAAAMRPAPMVRAMRGAVAAGVVAIAPAAAAAATSSGRVPNGGSTRSGGGVTVVNYQPHTVIQGSGPEQLAHVRRMLDAHKRDIERIVHEGAETRRRRSYEDR